MNHEHTNNSSAPDTANAPDSGAATQAADHGPGGHVHGPGCSHHHHHHIETFVRSSPKVGRNDPCPCGSGRKFKKCCG